MPSSARPTHRRPRNARQSSTRTPPSKPDARRSFEDDQVTSTRPTKRRKRTSQAEEPHDDTSATPDDDQLLTQITQQLHGEPVQAAKDHANAIHENNSDGVKAYAKIAASDWTYYITKLDIHIGRSPELSSLSRNPQNEHDSQNPVHIDLGPGKMVSRNHASISFDSKGEKWVLNVRGRNGAKVNTHPLKQGAQHELTSGDVVEIANVEMMFVLPIELTPLHVHPAFLERSNVSLSSNIVRAASQGVDEGEHYDHLTRTPTRKADPPTTPSSSRARPPAFSHTSEVHTPSLMSTPAIMLGSSNIDLSQEENQHIKPQFSYAQMITQAIMESPDERLNLNSIYQWIMDKYAYYRHQPPSGWQNSIRHNLSLNKAFAKVARSADEPGKGMKWRIVLEQREEMIKNAYRSGRGGHRGSSAPSSPNTLNYFTQGPKDMNVQESPLRNKVRTPRCESPTRSPLPELQSTPFRTAGLERHSREHHPLSDGSPDGKLTSSHGVTRMPADLAQRPQSPTLTSSYLQEDGHSSFITPAPPRVRPKLAPPSTMQQPSHFIQYSSPAPFWKYAETGSTPLKPPQMADHSPTKMHPGSSSPQNVRSPPSSPLHANKLEHERSIGPQKSEEDPSGGFDLTKGFQSIGSYRSHVGGQRFPLANAIRERSASKLG